MYVRDLPSVYIDCALSMLLGHKRSQLTCFGTSKSARSADEWLRITPPSHSLTVSAFASLKRPRLPRTDVISEEFPAGVGVKGVATGR